MCHKRLAHQGRIPTEGVLEMSELKSYDLVDIQDYRGEVYLKSEADKVIAEKDAVIAQLQAMLEERNSQIGNLDAIAKRNQIAAHTLRKKMNHHKYKRCLAMADKCVDLCHKSKDLYRWADDENLEHHYNHKIEFFARWHNRWLELAEQFKEAK